MEEHSKKYFDTSEFVKDFAAMVLFQKIHNIIRKDYMELLDLTERHKVNKTEFNALYRACLKSLFSLIEADIFGLNNLDKYQNYTDKDSFEIKFKNTFRQVCKTWNKNEIGEKYLDTKYCKLKELRKKRDELIHPKKVEHIHEANESEFDSLKLVFTDYDSFINELMKDFYIGIELNAKDFLGLK